MEEQKSTSVAYRPQPGDPETTEAYGRTFKAGEFVEIDPEFADRARHNPSFEVQGEKSYGDKLHEEKQEEPAETDLSFEEAVELERVQEYGTTDEDVADEVRKSRQYTGGSAAMSRSEAVALVEQKRRGRPPKVKAPEDAPPVDEDTRLRAEKAEADQADLERQQAAERDAEAERTRRLEAARSTEAVK